MPRDVSGYRLYEQVQSQPAQLERLLTAPEPVEEAARGLSAARRVFVAGIGTSSNAALFACYLLRAAGVDATLWSSYDFALYGPELRPGDAGLVLSHTGRKQLSRRAFERMKAAGAPVVWVAGTKADTEGADVTLRTVDQDRSAAYTVSHTAAMLLVARVAAAIRAEVAREIERVPGAVRDALGLEGQVAGLAQRWQGTGCIFAVGAGPHETSAHEVAIKVNEAARMRARGYAAEQFLHGPQAQLQPGDTLLLFAGPGAALERTATVAQFGLDVGAPVAWIAPEPGPEGVEWLKVADCGELLAPIVEIIPAQLLAAHLAALHDIDADSFRLDDPPFKKAFDRYSL